MTVMTASMTVSMTMTVGISHLVKFRMMALFYSQSRDPRTRNNRFVISPISLFRPYLNILINLLSCSY